LSKYFFALYQPRITVMHEHIEKPNVQAFFSSDVRNMDDWAQRTGIPLTTAEALGATYARAHGWLLSLRSQLVQHYGWRDSPFVDRRMLFTIESQPMLRSSGGLPLSPPPKLQLPLHASSFFSPERRVQWQMVFHGDVFATHRRMCQPVADIFNVIQCLLTGLVTLVHEENLPEGLHRTTRALPAVSWINANEAALTHVFGHAHFKKLRAACKQTASSHKLEILPCQPFHDR
jgi:hypothetical protein